MPAKPRSNSSAAQRASLRKHFVIVPDLNPRVDLARYVFMARGVLDEAIGQIKRGNTIGAYIELEKFFTLTIDRFPTHPSFRSTGKDAKLEAELAWVNKAKAIAVELLEDTIRRMDADRDEATRLEMEIRLIEEFDLELDSSPSPAVTDSEPDEYRGPYEANHIEIALATPATETPAATWQSDVHITAAVTQFASSLPASAPTAALTPTASPEDLPTSAWIPLSVADKPSAPTAIDAVVAPALHSALAPGISLAPAQTVLTALPAAASALEPTSVPVAAVARPTTFVPAPAAAPEASQLPRYVPVYAPTPAVPPAALAPLASLALPVPPAALKVSPQLVFPAEAIALCRSLLPSISAFHVPPPATSIVDLQLPNGASIRLRKDDFHTSFAGFLTGTAPDLQMTPSAMEGNRCFFIHLGVATGVHPFLLQFAFRMFAHEAALAPDCWYQDLLASVLKPTDMVDANALCFLWPKEFDAFRILFVSNPGSSQPIFTHFSTGTPDAREILVMCNKDHFTLLSPCNGVPGQPIRAIDEVMQHARRAGCVVQENEVHSDPDRSIQRVLGTLW